MKNLINDTYISFRLDVLEDSIRSRQLSLLKGINSGMIELFWHIGNQFNTSSDFQLENNGELQTKLEARYGTFFSGSALWQMKEFATACPEGYLHDIASSVGWKHIPILNTLANPNDWPRFAHMVQNDLLSPSDLKDRIENVNTHNTQKSPSATPKLLNGKLMKAYLSLMDLDYLFEGESGENFRKFYEPEDGMEQHHGQEEIGESLHQISVLIDQFRLESHVQVRLAANAAYHFIGYQIYSAAEALLDSGLTINDLLFNLEKRFEGKLTQQWLKSVLNEYNQDQPSSSSNEHYLMTQNHNNKQVQISLHEIISESSGEHSIYQDSKILFLLKNV